MIIDTSTAGAVASVVLPDTDPKVAVIIVESAADTTAGVPEAQLTCLRPVEST